MLIPDLAEGPVYGPQGTHFGVTDADDWAWMRGRLTAHPWACFTQKLEFDQVAVGLIPQYHVVCTRGLPFRDPELLRTARENDRLWVVDAGHDLMITRPEWLAAVLQELLTR